jgi:hypothetical protein
MADIQVQLWQDDYEDAAVGEGERPLADTTILFIPNLTWADSSDTFEELLTAQTDENGVAATSLGNGCEIVWIDPQIEGHFTKIRPAAIYDESRIGFEYDDGLLNVRMGITDKEMQSDPASVPPHQFTFANGSPNHPEGFGEWQLLLDRGGYFSLNHTV